MTEENRKLTTVEKRIVRNKEQVLEQLKKVPIVQVACSKVGIGRATYYRWRKDDPAFAEATEMALRDGVGVINDMAESQLITEMKEGNLSALTFWLRNRHPAYTTRIEVTGRPVSEAIVITEEQQEIIRRSVALVNPEPEAAPEDNSGE